MQKLIAPMLDGPVRANIYGFQFRISGSLRNRGRGRPAINKQNVGLSPSETNRDLLKRLFPDLEEQRVAHL